ncbi:MAG: hypothetical protein JSS65_11210 [Armatimonadetes bacterium]|nr:hypothetical protein [Armatimonadota bacterium]
MAPSVPTNYTSTEQFLASIEGVVSAQVWQRGSNVLGRVVVLESTELDGAELKLACREALGNKLTPDLLLLEKIKPTGLRLAA